MTENSIPGYLRSVGKVYTTGEAARVCYLSSSTITKFFDGGEIEGYKVPGSKDRRIPHKNLLKFMCDNKTPFDELEYLLRERKLIPQKIDSGESYFDSIRIVYKIGEAARACYISTTTIKKFFDEGEIEGYRINGSGPRKIPHKNLLEFMEEHNLPFDELIKLLREKGLIKF